MSYEGTFFRFQAVYSDFPEPGAVQETDLGLNRDLAMCESDLIVGLGVE